MIRCPYCSSEYQGYRIVGLQVADASGITWLEQRMPMALLFCRDCGRHTLMHPDHPEVQKMEPEPPLEVAADNVRTLNVDVEEVGDSRLRQQFEVGHRD